MVTVRDTNGVTKERLRVEPGLRLLNYTATCPIHARRSLSVTHNALPSTAKEETTMRLDPEKFAKGILAIQLFFCVLALAFWGAFIYVAVHFIKKYW